MAVYVDGIVSRDLRLCPATSGEESIRPSAARLARRSFCFYHGARSGGGDALDRKGHLLGIHTSLGHA